MQDKHYFNLKGKDAEAALFALAADPFFSDWCYLRPEFRKGKEKKEICDLLVLFDDIAIIWQLKDVALKDGKYKQSDIVENVRQLYGAKRQLFRKDVSIVLENERRKNVIFDASTVKRVYLISAFFGADADGNLFESFKDAKTHFFTREFTEIVLNELDTIKDFVDYLAAREKLQLTSLSSILEGEKNLLACYIANDYSFDELTRGKYTKIEAGLWEDFQKLPIYIRKKKSDEDSYLIDFFIDGAHRSGEEYEPFARALASLGRFERRALSRYYELKRKEAISRDPNMLYMYNIQSNGVTYRFCFMPCTNIDEFKNGLFMACMLSRKEINENTRVVGIAAELKDTLNSYHAFCLLDKPDFSDYELQVLESFENSLNMTKTFTPAAFREEKWPKV